MDLSYCPSQSHGLLLGIYVFDAIQIREEILQYCRGNLCRQHRVSCYFFCKGMKFPAEFQRMPPYLKKRFGRFYATFRKAFHKVIHMAAQVAAKGSGGFLRWFQAKFFVQGFVRLEKDRLPVLSNAQTCIVALQPPEVIRILILLGDFTVPAHIGAVPVIDPDDHAFLRLMDFFVNAFLGVVLVVPPVMVDHFSVVVSSSP